MPILQNCQQSKWQNYNPKRTGATRKRNPWVYLVLWTNGGGGDDDDDDDDDEVMIVTILKEKIEHRIILNTYPLINRVLQAVSSQICLDYLV